MLRSRLLAWAQGAYFALTGLWPLVSMGTFLAVTGPKTDLWLVRTVGVLVLVIGAVLLLAARRGVVAPEVRALAVGSALGLAAVDVVFVSTRTIPPIYLLDAVAEILLVLGWGLSRREEAGERPASSKHPAAGSGAHGTAPGADDRAAARGVRGARRERAGGRAGP